MKPVELLARAVEIAERAHRGQVDKAGAPYIDHPRRVMERLEGPVAKIVGVLHDAVEDSPLTLAELVELGFPPAVVDAVDAVTKREGELYEDYLQRVKSNPIALRVKIEDMRDNMDIGRISRPTDQDYQRLEKYRRILPQLEDALVRSPPDSGGASAQTDPTTGA